MIESGQVPHQHPPLDELYRGHETGSLHSIQVQVIRCSIPRTHHPPSASIYTLQHCSQLHRICNIIYLKLIQQPYCTTCITCIIISINSDHLHKLQEMKSFNGEPLFQQRYHQIHQHCLATPHRSINVCTEPRASPKPGTSP